MNPYENTAQQRILKLVLLLFSDVVNGFSTGQLARELECSPSYVTRDLANLSAAGLAEKMPGGNWRLTPRLPRQAVKIFTAIHAAEARIAEAKGRYGLY